MKRISPYSAVVGESVEATEGATMATMMMKDIISKASKKIDDEKKCHKPESQYYRAYCEEKEEEIYCEGCKFWY